MEKHDIDDAGEFLPYARKHMVGESIAISPKANAKTPPAITLQKLWPEPDWCQLQDVDLDARAALYVIYHNIRPSPRSEHWGVPQAKWEAAYIKSLGILQLLFSRVKTVAQSDRLFEDYLELLRKCCPEFTTSTRHINDSYHKYSTGRDDSVKKIGSAFSLGLRRALQKEWLVRFGWPANKNATKYRYFPVPSTTGTSWYVVTPTKTNYSWFNEDANLSEADALERAKTRNLAEFPDTEPTQSDKEPKSKPAVYTPKKKPVVSDSRIGPVFRAGDKTADDLIQEFGFRGIQFGNSLSNSERQQWINDAYDALCDLADVLGFKRSWIGLGGVGLAFGARGAGKASAHFEPSLNITNLTRSSGAGSFAHEFFHALDYRLGRKLDFNWYLTDNLVDKRCLYYQVVDKSLSASENQIRQITSLFEVYKAIGGFGDWYTDYYKRSATLAGQHGAKKYWIETIELFARAFESYIQDTLSNQGRFSPWLVHGTLESDCQPGRESMWPYPIAEERTVINKQFEVFIQTLTTK